MTDERIGDRLLATIRRLPPGSGIVFRHLATAKAERIALFRRIRRIAAARRLTLVSVGALAGSRGHGGRQPFTAPAHDAREAIAMTRRGARILFVSPVHATRTHPGAIPLGLRRAAAIGRGQGAARIALGGMTERRWRSIRRLGFDGWAAIDGLADRCDQKA